MKDWNPEAFKSLHLRRIYLDEPIPDGEICQGPDEDFDMTHADVEAAFFNVDVTVDWGCVATGWSGIHLAPGEVMERMVPVRLIGKKRW